MLSLVHNQLQENFDEQAKIPDHHPLMKRIDASEQNVIDKIHHTTNDSRKQL
jgi:hypothetical protein